MWFVCPGKDKKRGDLVPHRSCKPVSWFPSHCVANSEGTSRSIPICKQRDARIRRKDARNNMEKLITSKHYIAMKVTERTCGSVSL